ncbi:MAG: hypothetical protein V4671_17860, partial [Armatimonadota bacterium]
MLSMRFSPAVLIRSLALTGALIALNPYAARADVLFTNLGAGSSYNTSGSVGGSGGLDLAIGFTVTGTGTFTLTS